MSGTAIFVFRLYIAENTQNSTLALANLTALCRDYLPGRHTIEVVDVFRDPKRALLDGVRMTPTLLKVSPAPPQRIVGTLAQTRRVSLALGLEPTAA